MIQMGLDSTGRLMSVSGVVPLPYCIGPMHVGRVYQKKTHFELHEVTQEAEVNRKQDGMIT